MACNHYCLLHGTIDGACGWTSSPWPLQHRSPYQHRCSPHMTTLKALRGSFMQWRLLSEPMRSSLQPSLVSSSSAIAGVPCFIALSIPARRMRLAVCKQIHISRAAVHLCLDSWAATLLLSWGWTKSCNARRSQSLGMLLTSCTRPDCCWPAVLCLQKLYIAW